MISHCCPVTAFIYLVVIVTVSHSGNAIWGWGADEELHQTGKGMKVNLSSGQF